MQTHAVRDQDHQPHTTETRAGNRRNSTSPFQFAENGPDAVQIKTLQEMADNSPRTKQLGQLQKKGDKYTDRQEKPTQRKENRTGLPDRLKTGIENLSGYSMDNVRVHYNSGRPTQLQAHAYAQGTDIHIAPGQEKHLPHEAWHVVQQKQERVQPITQLAGGSYINEDASLEKEADVMGIKALQLKSSHPSHQADDTTHKNTTVYQLSIWSWAKKSAVSLFNFTVGAAYRVPKRVLNLAKHLTVDLIKAIYFACTNTNTNGGVGLMQEQAPLSNWAFGLLGKILDVANIRELIGLLTTILGTPLSEVRGLTTAEKNLAHEIFGNTMNLADVSILENSAISAPFAGQGGAFTVAHTIHGDSLFSDPHDQANNETRQAILMHELMHIAQEQKQGVLSWIELQWGRAKTGNAPIAPTGHQTPDPDYNYGVIAAGSRFRDFSREQQGAIVQDYAKYLLQNPVNRQPNDLIDGEYGSGGYQYYQAMLQGLRQGHWALPFQHPNWKKTIG